MPDEQMSDEEIDLFINRFLEELPEEPATPENPSPRFRRRKSFFYPACFVDWTPLVRFTHLCDTFIYCDYGEHSLEYSCELQKFIGKNAGLQFRDTNHSGVPLSSPKVEKLTTPHPDHAEDFPNLPTPWAKVFRLNRRIEGRDRPIDLIYFKAEAVTLYRNLFDGFAPRIICMKSCQDGFGGENWTSFLQWNGPLGRAVRDNPVRPEFVISWYDRDEPPRSHLNEPDWHHFDWPWSRLWQVHSGWQPPGEGSPNKLNCYVLPDALRVSAGTPLNSGSAFVARGAIRKDDTRTKVLVHLVRRPSVSAAIPEGDHRIAFTRGQDPTLRSALDRLRRDCTARQIEHAHAFGCEFEDEGLSITAWKWAGQWPRTLTIHCETDGELACYGPAADDIRL